LEVLLQTRSQGNRSLFELGCYLNQRLFFGGFMVTQKADPKHPLFKKIIQNRFRALLFGVPSVIGLLYLSIALNLDFWTEAALILCCTLFGKGVAYCYHAGDLTRQLKKDQKKQSSQA
jgi:hypothetical protein